MPKVHFKEAVSSPKEAVRAEPRTWVEMSRLLHARAFHVENVPQDPLIQQLVHNLQTVGGQVDEQAGCTIGKTVSSDGPHIGLGAHPGLLGPHSLGFVNNVEGIAPWAGLMARRPLKGEIAVVVPHVDALPEVMPLLVRRQLGVSWVISVGDGDPEAVLQFLQRDPATRAVLVALGKGARPVTLQPTLGEKPMALWGAAVPAAQMPLYGALARKTGTALAESLEEWLAFGEVWTKPLSRYAPRSAPPLVTVLGAGYQQVANQTKAMRLPAPTRVEPGTVEEVSTQLASYETTASRVVVCTDEEQPLALPPYALRVDPAYPERLQAVLHALAFVPLADTEAKPLTTSADPASLAAWLRDLPAPLYRGPRMVVQETLSDHDAKRLLHAYGVRVSRQAPAATVTAAVRVASKLSFPLSVLDPMGTEERTCDSLAALKRHVPLLLTRCAYVMVREWIPPAPRIEISLHSVVGLGMVLRMGTEAATLPLWKGEAKVLAKAALEPHKGNPAGLAALLSQLSECAHTHTITGTLSLYLADEPVVVTTAVSVVRSAAS